ncbi:MAG: hypothetical protein J2O48_01030 [Solirubrobacterales bacterium]|nr:hypothetical protein [Solirubrobacterales bacterium]
MRPARVTLITALVVAVSAAAPAVAASKAVPVDPSARVALGVTTLRLAAGWYFPWSASDLNSVNQVERQLHRHLEIVNLFQDWAHSAKPPLTALEQIRARGSVPEISWEPWNADPKASPRPTQQPAYSLASIISGTHDAYIRTWARGLKQFGRPVLLRFAQEMNIRSYSWDEGVNSNTKGQYVQAWRHVWRLFHNLGVRNVAWVWSPVAATLRKSDYPGGAYVNVIGVSGFNGGTLPGWDGWRSFNQIFSHTLTELHAMAPAKPVQITEIGSSTHGGNKSQWVRGMFAALKSYPYVTSVVSYDLKKQADWRIDSSASALAAFRAGAGTARYGQIASSKITGRL